MSFGTCPHCSRWGDLGHSDYIGAYRNPDAWVCLRCHLSAQRASNVPETERPDTSTWPPTKSIADPPNTHGGLLTTTEAQLAARLRRAYPWLRNKR